MHKNPVAFITGAAKRIGAAIAQRLHQNGYDIVLHYRHSNLEAQTLAASFEQTRSGSCLLISAELNQIAHYHAIMAQVTHYFGRLDVLVNNASTFYATPIGNVTEQNWEELMGSNAKAPFFLTQAATALLRAQQGCIVNIADIYADRPLLNHSVYCMAKAAVVMLTKSLAIDLAPEIRVNAIAPGAILWPESGKTDTQQHALISQSPLQRMGSPDDIAKAVLYLVKDAPFVTGEILHVDGGRAVTIK